VFQYIKGDKAIWAIVSLLALFSFLPVYSSSSNLAYLYGDGNTMKFLLKHLAHLVLGFTILYGVHRVPYHYFKGLSLIALPIVLLLLIITMTQGTTIEGANASRWIRIPVVGVTFQSSTLASVVLLTYVARYLAKIKGKTVTFKETLLPLWLPVFLVLALILPANFSTAAIIFSMLIVLVYIGGYPIKYLAVILFAGALFLTLFIVSAKAFPGAFPNRVDTWMSRIDNFMDGEETEADYQIEKAKIAIASGKITGLGPGKSIQKNFLPQSSSDFIYAIIAEEFGIIGALFLMSLYMFLLFRFVIVAHKAATIFGKLLVIGVGLPIIFVALINMAVAVEIFPVTGQTLPLVSSGGSSIWMTCLAIGMVLSVSANREVIKNEEEEEYPAVAIANELKVRYPDAEFLFVGAKDRMEMEKVPQAGYKIKGLWISGLQRSLTIKNLMFPFKLIASLWVSKKIIKSFRPNVAIGTGGYASAPLLKVASNKGIPCLIQEQNSYAGITNKWLSNKVKSICVAYDGMEQFFPSEKIKLTGNPVRQDLIDISGKREEAVSFFKLDSTKKTLLILGGSLGAKKINELVNDSLSLFSALELQVIWQCGSFYFETYKNNGNKTVQIHAFLNRMDLAYAASDFIISRAGALSVSELCLVGKPVLFIPSPNVAEDHQTKNALAIATKNAALLIKENELDAKFEESFSKLIASEQQQQEFSKNIKELAKPNATNEIIAEIERLLIQKK